MSVKINENFARYLPFWFVAFIASRTLYFVVAFIWEKAHRNQYSLSVFCQFDCKWYLRVIENGYLDTSKMPGHEGATNWAFFPTFPLITRFVAHILHLDPIATGLFLNLLLSVSALYILNKYLLIDFSTKTTNFALFLFAFSPANAYFNSVYSEAMYSFLLVFLLYAVRMKNYVLIGVLGTLLSTTRVTGLFVSILVFTYMILEKKNLQKIFLSFPIIFILPGLFFSYAFVQSGDFLKPIHAHKAWGVQPKNPITWVSNVFGSTSVTTWGYFLLTLVLIFICIYFNVKKRHLEILSIAPVVLSSIFTTQINYRYSLAIYPVYLFIALITDSQKLIRPITYVLSVIGLVASSIFWITNQGFMV